MNAPSSRLSRGDHPRGSTTHLSATSMSNSTPCPGMSWQNENPSFHPICWGKRSVANVPGLRGISWTPTLVDAMHSDTHAAAETGPRGLCGTMSM